MALEVSESYSVRCPLCGYMRIITREEYLTYKESATPMKCSACSCADGQSMIWSCKTKVLDLPKI